MSIAEKKIFNKRCQEYWNPPPSKEDEGQFYWALEDLKFSPTSEGGGGTKPSREFIIFHTFLGGTKDKVR